MLISLSALAMVLLSEIASWLSDGLGDAPQQAGNTPITPRDPSTLTLALIGVGTIAIYVAAKWRPSRSDVVRWTGRLSDQSERAEAADAEEQRPSRGAA